MSPKCRLLRPSLCALLLVVPAASCKRGPETKLEAVDEIVRETNAPPPPKPVRRDLARIPEGDTLTVLAPYNSTTCFVYRGGPLGYEHELLREFAAPRGRRLSAPAPLW